YRAHDCRLRYVTAGLVPRSSSSLLPRDDRDNREAALSGSSRSPNPSAWAGQACAQAGLISPSPSLRSSALAWIVAALIRCTQNVHLSITPTSRSETSGLSCRWSGLSPGGIQRDTQHNVSRTH